MLTTKATLFCCCRVVREAAAKLLRRWGSRSGGTGGSSPEKLQLMGGLAGDMVTPRSLLGSRANAAESDGPSVSSAHGDIEGDNDSPNVPIGSGVVVAVTDGPSAAANVVTPNVLMGGVEGIDPLEATNTVSPQRVTVTMLAVQLPLMEGQPSPPTVDFAIRVHDFLRDEHGIEVRMRTDLPRLGVADWPSRHLFAHHPPVGHYPEFPPLELQVQYPAPPHIQVPVACAEGKLWVRISAQIYNRTEEYERLAAAVEGMRAIDHRD